MSSQPSMPPPPLSLSPLERPAFAHLFSIADPSKSGRLTGDAAVAFFSRARPSLEAATLGHIWTLSDSANNGFLVPASFSIALRLIGHAQRGEPVDEAAIHKPGPPPTFEGVALPAQASAGSFSGFAPSNRLSTIPPSATAPISNIEITAADRARYVRIFAGANPVNGLLDGDKAKDIFVKSKLPFDKLGAIWSLADTRARGALDLTDFIIGMYFIQHTMSGKLNSIPSALPAGLYEQAAAGTPGAQVPTSPIPQQMTGGSASGTIPRQLTGQQAIPRQLTGQGIMSPVQRQMTGQGPPSALRVGSPTPSGFASPARATHASHLGGSAFGVQQEAWAVTPADKAKSDRFFDGLDTEQTGALDGQTVVPFFVQSGLGEAVLAHVWDLSDITQSGSLSRDEFAVSMYLIQGKLAGKDLPDKLPPNLVPPSLRGQSLPEAVNPQESVTQRDLFSLMDDEPAALPISTASAFIPATQLQPTPSKVSLRAAPAPPQSATSGPFEDDFFGGSAPQVASPQAALTPVATGTSQSRATISAPVQNEGSSEIGNKQLQLDSTTKAVDSLQQQRSQLESTISTGATSLADLENRLTSVRALHQTESKLVADLQERQRAQSAELRKLQQESISEESVLSKLRAEKAEIEQIVLKEREDVRDLKHRMAEVQTETKELKTQLEKLKKDARQSKGLLAISKKQLTTAEAEQEKTKEEIAAAERGEPAEAETIAPQVGATNTQPSSHAASRDGSLSMPGANGSVATADVTSPSSVRSLNPFDRAGQTETVSSPQSSSTALGAGAALGAATATAAVAGTAGFDDAFGSFTAPGVDANAHEKEASTASAAAFDDTFGSSFVPPTADTGRSNTQAAGATAFDDAFASFDAPASGDASESHGQAIDSAGAFGSSFEPVNPPPTVSESAAEGSSAFEPKTADSEGFKAADESADTAAGSVPGDGPSSQLKETADETPFGEGQSANATEEPDSSDDEEEGPEDLDANPISRGVNNTDPVVPEPSASIPAITSTAPSSSPPAAGVPAASAAQAAERFPDLDDEPVVPGALSTEPEPITDSRDLSENALTAPAPAISKRSSLAPTDGYGTDTGDGEFHDAETGALSPTRDIFTEGHESPALHSAVVGSAFSTRSEASDAGALRHERYETAAGGFDDAFGTDEGAAVPALPGANAAEQRPSSPTKTRRAPPPAPVRGASGVVASGVVNADAFGPSQSANTSSGVVNGATSAPAPAPASFDDFEAAFEDLGAPTAAAPTAAHGSEPSTAFDDAFGQDADFDFVPSFSNPSATAGQAGGASAPSSAFASAFDEFDSSFPSTNGPGGTAPAAGLTQPTTGNTSTTSNSGSGFSFEDAFAPSQSEVLPTGAPPSLPARQATGGAGASAANASSKVALPDDAPPVKQLCGMGFDRDAVIKALEKSNYRTERALEKLLAGSG